MKKLFLILVILSANFCFAQTGWFWQNPKPQGTELSVTAYVNSTTIYAAGKIGGTFIKTTNSGGSWQVKNIFPVKDSSIYTVLSMAVTNENNIYLLCQYDLSQVIFQKFFVMRSTNAGETWDSVNVTGNTYSLIDKISFVNQNTGYCYAYYNSAVYSAYKTTNAGTNWQRFFINGSDTINSLFFLNANTGWAAKWADDKLYKTTDGGASWATFTSGTFPFRTYQPFFINENTGWKLYQYSVLKTTNGGANYFQIGTAPSTPEKYGFFDENNGWAIILGQLYKTSNSGSSWQKTLENVFMFTDASFTSSSGIACGRGGKMFRTTNTGNTWTEFIHTQNNSAYISDICFVNAFTGWSLMSGEVMKTTDGGDSWQKKQTDTTYFSLEFIDGNTGVFLTNDFFDRTTNGGTNWLRYNYSGYRFRNAYLVSANTWYLLAEYGNFDSRILKTTNAGVNWNTLNQSFTTESLFFFNETTGFSFGDGLRKTTNGGVNWIFSGGISTGDIYYFTNENTGWTAYDDYIFKTINAGLNWTLQAYKPGYDFKAIKFANSLTGWCAANFLETGRVLKTTNGGANWFNDLHFYTSSFTDMNLIGENTLWVAGFDENIIKTTTGGTIGVQQVSTVVPDKFYLEQNYPNPFNPVTNIEFSLPQSSFVKLKVFDLLGREVQELVRENLSAGKYKYDFNASALPSGIYFYKLETENFSETRKMILAK